MRGFLRDFLAYLGYGHDGLIWSASLKYQHRPLELSIARHTQRLAHGGPELYENVNRI